MLGLFPTSPPWLDTRIGLAADPAVQNFRPAVLLSPAVNTIISGLSPFSLSFSGRRTLGTMVFGFMVMSSSRFSPFPFEGVLCFVVKTACRGLAPSFLYGRDSLFSPPLFIPALGSAGPPPAIVFPPVRSFPNSRQPSTPNKTLSCLLA